MFINLNVLSADASSQRLSLSPETTLSEVCERILQTLPEEQGCFSDVKLIQGERLLTDGNALEAEVQAVKVTSPDKVVRELKKILLRPGRLCSGGVWVPCPKDTSRLEAALTALHGIDELTYDQQDGLENLAMFETEDAMISIEIQKILGRLISDPAAHLQHLHTFILSRPSDLE